MFPGQMSFQAEDDGPVWGAGAENSTATCIFRLFKTEINFLGTI